MKLFIDFDDVILNTREFSADLRDFFSCNGVDQDVFQKYYYDENDDNPVKLFDPDGLFSRLERYEQMDIVQLRKNFSDYLKNLSRFVFDDVEKFLKFVGKENLYLISFGLPEYQNEKIVACGIDEFVSGCVVTKGLKSQAIKKVIEAIEINSKEEIIFIDDRVEQIEDVKKCFPEARTFLICRKEGRYCDKRNEYCDYYVSSLAEIQGIISRF